MMSRPHRIVMYLIEHEVKRRKRFWHIKREMPRNFSKAPIAQMRAVLKAKRLNYNENHSLTKQINQFKKSIL